MYIVIEIQKLSNSQVATIINSYEDSQVAEQKYHLILSAAAVSSVLIHSAVILDETGYQIKKETYYHNFSEPKSESESEEPEESEPEEPEEP